MKPQRESCEELLFELALSDPRNASPPKSEFASAKGASLQIVASEIELLQPQIDSLDLTFLEHIPVAHGLFQMQIIDSKLPFEMDSDDDDSTADMTDDSVSTDESSDLTRSCTQNEINESHEAPRMNERIPPSRPNLLSSVPGPNCMSLRTFDIEETESLKLQIKTVARQFKIIQKNIRSDRAKRKSRQSLQWWSEEEDDSMSIEMERSDSQEERLDRSKQDKPNEIEQLAYLTEIETIRAQLDANEIRIRNLRDERNKDAALSLIMELMIARSNIVPPEVEQFILSVAELKMERKELRDRLRSAGIDDADVEATLQWRRKERELESTRIMQELSLTVQELQNDKNELSEQTRLLRITMGNLEATSLNLDARIDELESACRILAKSESEGFDKPAGVIIVPAPSKRRGVGISRIFRRLR